MFFLLWLNVGSLLVWNVDFCLLTVWEQKKTVVFVTSCCEHSNKTIKKKEKENKNSQNSDQWADITRKRKMGWRVNLLQYWSQPQGGALGPQCSQCLTHTDTLMKLEKFIQTTMIALDQTIRDKCGVKYSSAWMPPHWQNKVNAAVSGNQSVD